MKLVSWLLLDYCQVKKSNSETICFLQRYIKSSLCICERILHVNGGKVVLKNKDASWHLAIIQVELFGFDKLMACASYFRR